MSWSKISSPLYNYNNIYVVLNLRFSPFGTLKMLTKVLVSRAGDRQTDRPRAALLESNLLRCTRSIECVEYYDDRSDGQ